MGPPLVSKGERLEVQAVGALPHLVPALNSLARVMLPSGYRERVLIDGVDVCLASACCWLLLWLGHVAGCCYGGSGLLDRPCPNAEGNRESDVTLEPTPYYLLAGAPRGSQEAHEQTTVSVGGRGPVPSVTTRTYMFIQSAIPLTDRWKLWLYQQARSIWSCVRNCPCL